MKMRKRDPAGSFGEESRRIIVQVKQGADDILATARAILDEAKSVQTSLDDDLGDDRAKARRIGFDEGFRAGRAQGEEMTREDDKPPRKKPSAIRILREAAGRLRKALDGFEEDRRRYLDRLKDVVRHLSVSADGDPKELPEPLAKFLQEEPPQAAILPEDEIWLERAPDDGEELEPSLATSGVTRGGGRGRSRPGSSSTRGKGRRRRGDVSR